MSRVCQRTWCPLRLPRMHWKTASRPTATVWLCIGSKKLGPGLAVDLGIESIFWFAFAEQLLITASKRVTTIIQTLSTRGCLCSLWPLFRRWRWWWGGWSSESLQASAPDAKEKEEWKSCAKSYFEKKLTLRQEKTSLAEGWRCAGWRSSG